MGSFVWSPIRFFESRLRKPPGWPLALTAPILCGVLDMAAVLVLATKNGESVAQLTAALPLNASSFAAVKLSSVLSIAGYPLYFVLMAVIVASVDTILLDSGRQIRLVKLVGLAFFSFLPVCAATLVIALLWTPPSFPTPSGQTLSEVQVALTAYLGEVRADPALSTLRVLYFASLAWCGALAGSALRVASGVPTAVAATTALLIFVAFSGLWR